MAVATLVFIAIFHLKESSRVMKEAYIRILRNTFVCDLTDHIKKVVKFLKYTAIQVLFSLKELRSIEGILFFPEK